MKIRNIIIVFSIGIIITVGIFFLLSCISPAQEDMPEIDTSHKSKTSIGRNASKNFIRTKSQKEVDAGKQLTPSAKSRAKKGHPTGNKRTKKTLKPLTLKLKKHIFLTTNVAVFC